MCIDFAVKKISGSIMLSLRHTSPVLEHISKVQTFLAIEKGNLLINKLPFPDIWVLFPKPSCRAAIELIF
jgi:hypothetical protein